MALSTNTKFWLSRIGVMVAVIAGTVAFLLYVPEPGTEMATAGAGEEKKNNISDSVSRFYAEFRQSSTDPIKERFGEYTILLENQNDLPLGKSIEKAVSKNYQPVSNWQGALKQRAFAASSTLKQEAANHISKEGFNLVWDLNQDFIIRNRYQSNNTLVGMLEEIAGAVDSNFGNPIFVYYCASKRAYVITERESDYLVNNCEKSGGLSQSY